MRGATAPRLILELIMSRIVITAGDGRSRRYCRIERLERQLSMEPMPTSAKPAKSAPAKEAPQPAATAPVKEAKKAEPAVTSTPNKRRNLDVTALRRMWPEVIENVKKKRRLTWTLLSASAQILSVDENHITIGIVNAGARDSFIRSESEKILSDAFVEVTGMRKKIEVVVDPSIDPYSPSNVGKRTDEDPSDANQLAGTELIMKELGAQVIAESEK